MLKKAIILDHLKHLHNLRILKIAVLISITKKKNNYFFKVNKFSQIFE
jgi:hypothetical protein